MIKNEPPLWHEEVGPDEGGGMLTYRIHRDGRVVVYRPELGTAQRLWIASSWSKDPRTNDDAVHLTHIAADSTWAELQAALKEWEAES